MPHLKTYTQTNTYRFRLPTTGKTRQAQAPHFGGFLSGEDHSTESSYFCPIQVHPTDKLFSALGRSPSRYLRHKVERLILTETVNFFFRMLAHKSQVFYIDIIWDLCATLEDIEPNKYASISTIEYAKSSASSCATF